MAMKKFTEQKLSAWRQHGEIFSCLHEDVQLRKRTIRGGSVQFVYQCQRCGDAMRQPLPRVKALELCGGCEPPPFDPKLGEDWSRLKSESADAISAKFSQRFWSDYSVYLLSPEWAERRRLALARAEGICEGCRKEAPTEVHHLTYDHVGQEFLFELVAVCPRCHSQLHPDEPSEER